MFKYSGCLTPRSEIQATLEAFDRQDKKIKTRADAKAFLIRMGLLTKSGKPSKKYYP